MSKPSFIIRPRRQFTDEGGKAKFKASFDGKPEPSVNWEKDGQVITKSSKYNIYKEKLFDYLEVLAVTEEDGGSYACVLSNSAGSESASAELEVYVRRKSAAKPSPLASKTPASPLSAVSPLRNRTQLDLGQKLPSKPQDSWRQSPKTTLLETKRDRVSSPKLSDDQPEPEQPVISKAESEVLRPENEQLVLDTEQHSSSATVESVDPSKNEPPENAECTPENELSSTKSADEQPIIDQNETDLEQPSSDAQESLELEQPPPLPVEQPPPLPVEQPPMLPLGEPPSLHHQEAPDFEQPLPKYSIDKLPSEPNFELPKHQDENLNDIPRVVSGKSKSHVEAWLEQCNELKPHEMLDTSPPDSHSSKKSDQKQNSQRLAQKYSPKTSHKEFAPKNKFGFSSDSKFGKSLKRPEDARTTTPKKPGSPTLSRLKPTSPSSATKVQPRLATSSKIQSIQSAFTSKTQSNSHSNTSKKKKVPTATLR